MVVQRNEFALPEKIDPLFFTPPSDFLGFLESFPAFFLEIFRRFSGDLPWQIPVIFARIFAPLFAGVFLENAPGFLGVLLGAFLSLPKFKIPPPYHTPPLFFLPNFPGIKILKIILDF